MTTTGARTAHKADPIPGPAVMPGFFDAFDRDLPPGRVIGSTGPGGLLRRGIDAEGRISVDNGQLRIGMLARPGWGRAALAYGPFARKPGLAFAALILNGHNSSQTYEMPAPHRRVARWVLGSPGADPLWQRLAFWPLRLRRESALRQLLRWLDHRPRRRPRPRIADNLAVGWFPDEVPTCAADSGHALVMRSADHDGGELRVRTAGSTLPVARGLGNLPIHYIVVLRERGAAYYAASMPGSDPLGGHPSMRPLGIDPSSTESALYAAVHQSVLGEIGFSVDTRLHGVRIAQVPALAAWYGSASAADALAGSGPLDGSSAEVGGRWRLERGAIARSARGALPGARESLATLDPPGPAGLLHAFITPGESAAGLVWRFRDADHHWRITLTGDRAELGLVHGGVWTAVASAPLPPTASPAAVQVLDDGRRITAVINGRPLAPPVDDARLADAARVGLYAAGPGPTFRDFEAHPRVVPIPEELDLGPTWATLGGRPVLRDDFGGPPADLHGRAVPGEPAAEWRRTVGRGLIETSHATARVRASIARPNPGRTAYTVPWAFPEFADLEVDITPPGTARGQGHNGRGGLIFWQDPRNYIIVNLWLTDAFGGATLSSFFHLRGHENLYDAVWTNIGHRVTWGRAFRYRMTFDGLNYLVLVDGEPVMYRSLRDVYPAVPRLRIRRVGLCANWEFGDDTGTRFNNFVARSRDAYNLAP